MLIIYYSLIAAIFLCWGSFLNVVAYRLIHHIPFFAKRSKCPHCHATLIWYDLIPIISWIALRGHCRTCKQTISPLYPLIEALTLISFLGLFFLLDFQYFFPYALFFSALIITIRTDLETMFILRYCTLFMIPIALFLSYLEILPITPLASITGGLFGYSILWLIRYLYWCATGLIGIGQGDLELLAMIGAFLGPLNCWFTLLIGSFLGSAVGVVLTKGVFAREESKIAFGPYLALAAIIVLLFQDTINSFW